MKNKIFRNNIKDERAITLISLVITIIVLLILAGISIGLLTGNNSIIGKAGIAKTDTEIAEEKEILKKATIMAIGKDRQGYLNKDNLDNELINYKEIDNTEETEAGIKVIFKSRRSYLVDYDGNIEIIIDKPTRMASDILKVNTSATNDHEKSPYVNYVDQNGDIILCRVLYDSSSQYGIEIISEESVEKIYIGKNDTTVSASEFLYSGKTSINDTQRIAGASYNKYITTLNNKANNYLNTDGIANRARCVGSNPSNPIDTTQYFTSTYPFFKNRGWNNILKEGDSNSTIDVLQMKDLGILKRNYSYWLASRCIEDGMATPTDPQGEIAFSVRAVYTNSNNVNNDYIFEVWYSGGAGSVSVNNSGDGDYFYGIRPVFHLSENAKIVSGEGTLENPYNLGL